MKQLPNLNKKEENFVAELLEQLSAHLAGNNSLDNLRFYFSDYEIEMLKEITSKITDL